MPKSNFLLIIVIAALTGLTIFATMIWRVTQVEDSSAAEAQVRFKTIRTRFEFPTPIFQLGTKPQRRAIVITPESGPPAPDNLLLLVYHQETGQLVSTRVPFWFYELKAPAVEVVLRGAGFDPVAMGITVEDLRGHGSAILLDEMLDNGDRLLVWTE